MIIFKLGQKILSLSILVLPIISFQARSVEFQFNVKIDKQTCKISVTGTSNNEVDFGSISATKIKNNQIDPIPIKVLLSDCKTSHFNDTYVTMTAKNSLNNVTFNDDAAKNFGIRLSNKDSVAQSSTDTDFIKSGDKIWTNIDSNNLEKTFYTYVKCQTGSGCNSQAGEFSSTLTFSYYVD